MAKVIATDAQIKAVSKVWFEFNPLSVEGDDKAFTESYASFISKSLDHLTRGRPAFELARYIKQVCRKQMEVRVTNATSTSLATLMVEKYKES